MTMRASCTGTRTGEASGKNRARPETMLAFCAERAMAVAVVCPKRSTPPKARTRPLSSLNLSENGATQQPSPRTEGLALRGMIFQRVSGDSRCCGRSESSRVSQRETTVSERIDLAQCMRHNRILQLEGTLLRLVRKLLTVSFPRTVIGDVFVGVVSRARISFVAPRLRLPHPFRVCLRKGGDSAISMSTRQCSSVTSLGWHDCVGCLACRGVCIAVTGWDTCTSSRPVAIDGNPF